MAARSRSPRSEARHWAPSPDRPDIVALLEEQAETRVRELVPIRHARMLASPFAFYRGAALIMATDLTDSADSGLTVQLCGDAHLSNFGVFGTPERALIFDINDFDETLPGPWEWDLKRLTASFEVAGRHANFTEKERRATVLAAARGYRERMRQAADAPVLTAWYDRLDAEHLTAWVREQKKANRAAKRQVDTAERTIAKARRRTSQSVFAKLAGIVDGELRILSRPPLIVPIEEIDPEARSHAVQEETMRQLLSSYRSTLTLPHHPIDEFRYRHMARKVVGIGSVGTRAWVLLLSGRDDHDPLLLQAKEAQASVLERFLPASEYENHGERVVRGQRLMQAASDIFLGWQRTAGPDGVSRDFYLRQLHDGKGSFESEGMTPKGTMLYARICGETLARAHARSGDRVAIAAYLGRSGRFDRAMADFAALYAEQNELDYRRFAEAVASGRLQAADITP